MSIVRPHWLNLDKPNWEIKSKPANDATGDKRGAVGFGKPDKEDREFLSPDFDTKRQVGQRAVGMFATADNPGVVNNAELEGDDV